MTPRNHDVIKSWHRAGKAEKKRSRRNRTRAKLDAQREREEAELCTHEITHMGRCVGCSKTIDYDRDYY